MIQIIYLLIYLVTMSKITNLLVWEFDMFNFQNHKPKWKIINCTSCTGFWITLLSNLFFLENLFLIIGIAFVVSYTSVMMEKKIRMFYE